MWIVPFPGVRRWGIRELKERIIFPLMYGTSMESRCFVNLTVTKGEMITGYHSGCLVTGFDVFEIALMVRVGYL